MRIIGEYLVVSPCLDPRTFRSQWDGCWGYRIWYPTCKWCKTIDFTIKFFISRHWSKINRISDIDMSKQWWMMMDDDGWWWMMMDDDGLYIIEWKQVMNAEVKVGVSPLSNDWRLHTGVPCWGADLGPAVTSPVTRIEDENRLGLSTAMNST